MVELYSDEKIIGNALAAMNSTYRTDRTANSVDLLHIAQSQLILTSLSPSSLSTHLTDPQTQPPNES
jgi:hypothetical protein